MAAFTKCLADIGKGDGVQVNCVHPSLVETERQWSASAPRSTATGEAEDKVRARFVKKIGLHPLRQGGGCRRSGDVPRLRAPDLDARRHHRPRRRRDWACFEHPAHPRAHRAGRDPEPDRHAADDDARLGRRRHVTDQTVAYYMARVRGGTG